MHEVSAIMKKGNMADIELLNSEASSLYQQGRFSKYFGPTLLESKQYGE